MAAADQTNNPFFLWNNRINTISVSPGIQTNGDVENVLTQDTADRGRFTVDGSNSTFIRFTVSQAISCVAIAAHNLGTDCLGCEVRVQYSDDGGTIWNDPGAGPVSPTDNQAIVWRFDQQSHADWRLRITNNTAGLPEIGVMIAGFELIIPQRFYQGYSPPLTPTEVRLSSRRSEGGQFLGSTVTSYGSSAAFDLTLLEDTFIRDVTWLNFQNHMNDGGAAMFCWRPTKYGDAFWGWLESPLRPSNTGPKALMGVQMNLGLYHDDT